MPENFSRRQFFEPPIPSSSKLQVSNMVKSFLNIVTLLVAATAITAAPIEDSDLPLEKRACADVVVHFARGTTEAPLIGAIVGPPFQAAIAVALSGKSLSFEGVNYPATVSGFLVGGDPTGSTTLANSVIATANACPNAKIVMSGYSQGGQLVHNAAAKLSTAIQNRVNAVVIFGDPKRDQALPSILEARRKTFCASGDLICDGTAIILAPHLSYGANAAEAAAFVKARV
ncbi:hypothetical protein D9619_012988 [Psilocybe cf. subviscida]|uniref:Cutinase n=1 Tax=Psilocybe cf. subviscida TaxID=2480587 RepID=A0A8H5F511_9AGAR|nr:hypothetical protein D9619_012988 [Psilocybe cf. subviscida]